MSDQRVLTVRDVGVNDIRTLLGRFGLSLRLLDDDAKITGTYWGEPEAGITDSVIYARGDTPVHSVLHETCHVICMQADRRNALHTDAGGDDLEEAAVCYLQVVLADEINQVGRDRLMHDMDEWGYSFRLGNTRRWFDTDADDAREWLVSNQLMNESGEPTFRLRP